MESIPERDPEQSPAAHPEPNPEISEAQLKAVGRLLALKRHETPPPGFFRDFQRQVRRQIEDETQARRTASPFTRFLDSLRTRPAFAGANALIVAGLAVLAVTAVLRQPNPLSPGNPGSKQTPVVAGFGGAQPGSWNPVTDQTPILPQTFLLRAGVTYRIEFLSIDSNAVPEGIFTRPTPDFEHVRWPR